MKSVRGTRDLVGESYDQYSHFTGIYTRHMSKYGFRGIEPAILEHGSLFAKQLGETSDVVSKEMYVVNSLSSLVSGTPCEYDTVLRPEGTIPTVRSAIGAGIIDEANLRLFYYGPMFRYNRPQKGRLRQFNQFGCEVLNVDSAFIDAEVIECLCYLLKEVGVGFVLHINTLGSGDELESYKQALYWYLLENQNKLKELNQRRLHTNVMRVLDQLDDEEKELLRDGMPNIIDHLSPEDRGRFDQVCELLRLSGTEYVVDPYLVRGLDYYKHTVFELVVDGSSIAGGGCYKFDRSKFIGGKSGKEISGIGWAIGYERIEELMHCDSLESTKLFLHGERPEIVYKVAQELRQQGLNCVTVYNFDKNALKKAKLHLATHIVTCGDAEHEVNVRSFGTEKLVKLKQLIADLLAK